MRARGLQARIAAILTTVLSAAALWKGWSPPAAEVEAQEQQAGPVSCYDAARTRTLLSDEEAIKLCCGLPNAIPVECYLSLTTGTTIDDFEAMEVCECSVSMQPAQCYMEVTTRTDLDERSAVELCKQTLTPVLPIPAQPPVRGENQALESQKTLDEMNERLQGLEELQTEEIQQDQQQFQQQQQADEEWRELEERQAEEREALREEQRQRSRQSPQGQTVEQEAAGE